MHTLPLYDLTAKKARFAKSRERVRPLPNAEPDPIEFSAWRLAHAVKKAECTKPLMPHVARIASLGFVLENNHLFDWHSDNFRLANDAIAALEDFSRTGLAGRVAQGMAMLCMEQQGYAFVDRFSAFCRRHNVSTTTIGKRNKLVKRKTPDFVFEKDAKNRALVEAKGGFVAEGSLANIKGELADALEQLAPWGGQFNPSINKKFAIGTFLRELGDEHEEQSLIALVDPDGEQNAEYEEVPPESIRRANYAAWLRGMGYGAVSQRITSSDREGSFSAKFLVSEFLDREYAIVPLGWVAPHDGSLLTELRYLDDWIDDPVFLYRSARRANARIVVAALDFNILRTIGTSSTRNEWSELLDIQPNPSMDYESNRQYAEGSSFADGSFFGAMKPNIPLHHFLRVEKVDF
ncbi:hypothetical protein MAFF301560_27790 [Ralstonia solanacearum]|nr:hypothetical protein MAFF301560_27790 [Ralstonia solanacearum]BEU45855.1 hypothetical protein MAFF211519_11800 [Ralstonia pseudosolanacearum]